MKAAFLTIYRTVVEIVCFTTSTEGNMNEYPGFPTIYEKSNPPMLETWSAFLGLIIM